MSGFYINDARLLTTMCLLFDKIHLPNNLEYVINFAERYRFQNSSEKIEIEIQAVSSNDSNPLINLTANQQITANRYLKTVLDFSVHNHKLFGEILMSDFFPNNRVMNAELVKQGAPGELNTYKVRVNPMEVTLAHNQDEDHYKDKLQQGFIPIFGKNHIHQHMQADKYSTKFLASILAMKSIDLVLPPIKAANPEVILETRYNLRDYLPLFWSKMLRFSQQFKNSLNSNVSITDLMYDSNDFVDSHIRPILIDIDAKMRIERATRFKNILSPNEKDSLCLSMGQPVGTRSDIIDTGVALGTGIENRRINTQSDDEVSGLTFLLNLATVLSTER
ncbi:hypothetical protein ACIQZI_13325 [Peribacillus sp. NPDC096379]|uniref:hypothetical protein n=1 Tax=Peribacillus sp. NPDC096379 TaxID=3364393 RepID=UPI0038194DBF